MRPKLVEIHILSPPFSTHQKERHDEPIGHRSFHPPNDSHLKISRARRFISTCIYAGYFKRRRVWDLGSALVSSSLNQPELAPCESSSQTKNGGELKRNGGRQSRWSKSLPLARPFTHPFLCPRPRPPPPSAVCLSLPCISVAAWEARGQSKTSGLDIPPTSAAGRTHTHFLSASAVRQYSGKP